MTILLIVLVLGAFFCLYRALRGPSISDRVIAADIVAVIFSSNTGSPTCSTSRSRWR
jgi:multisubunit Na+/H+ antiporter MnhF subunit